MEDSPDDRYDDFIERIADYAFTYRIDSDAAYERAYLSLIDGLGCGIRALTFPECVRVIEPRWADAPSTGARVVGTTYMLEPMQAAFSIGACMRWMDFNDMYPSETPMHPSENFIPLLPVADYLSRTRARKNQPPLVLRDVLTLFIKSLEVLGVIAIHNDFTTPGFDNAGIAKISMAPFVAQLLGGDRDAVKRATSQAIVDGLPTEIYRVPPNIGWRKSWGPADAGSRAINLATIALQDETGYKHALTAKRCGFYDVFLGGKPLDLSQAMGTFFAENIVFKLPYPAEGTTQTVVEAGMRLHDQVKDRLDEIDHIELKTSRECLNYAYNPDPLVQLTNPAARDHDISYVATLALIFGKIDYSYYEDLTAQMPEVRGVLGKIKVTENPDFTQAWEDPSQRATPNSLQVFFTDGTSTETATVMYSLGTPRRAKEGTPLLFEKLRDNLKSVFTQEHTERVVSACNEVKTATAMPVDEFVELWTPSV